MAILGEGFNPKFTKFEEFKKAVHRFTDERASEDKIKMINGSRNVSSPSNLSVDLYNRIYLKLPTGESIKAILYVDSQLTTDEYFFKHEILPENLNRYHIYKCPAVDNIFAKGIKFAVTSRRDGKFHYSFVNNFGELLYETENQPLLICKSCLNEFNIRHNTNFSNREFQPYLYFDS